LDEWLNIVPFALGAGQFELLHQHGAGIDRKSATHDVELVQRAKLAGKKLTVKPS
jgi:hypothetical protein